jgi:hypothetical protein
LFRRSKLTQSCSVEGKEGVPHICICTHIYSFVSFRCMIVIMKFRNELSRANLCSTSQSGEQSIQYIVPVKVKVKVKLSLYQTMEAHRVVRH